MSLPGKKIVTTHSDIWEDNILVPKNSGLIWAIDFDHTCTSYAVNDISQIFMFQVFGTEKLASKKIFIKAYLQALNYDTSEEAINLLIFDAQCAALRTFCEYSFF